MKKGKRFLIGSCYFSVVCIILLGLLSIIGTGGDSSGGGNKLSVPTTAYPPDNAVDIDPSALLKWNEVPGATDYMIYAYCVTCCEDVEMIFSTANHRPELPVDLSDYCGCEQPLGSSDVSQGGCILMKYHHQEFSGGELTNVDDEPCPGSGGGISCGPKAGEINFDCTSFDGKNCVSPDNPRDLPCPCKDPEAEEGFGQRDLCTNLAKQDSVTFSVNEDGNMEVKSEKWSWLPAWSWKYNCGGNNTTEFNQEEETFRCGETYAWMIKAYSLEDDQTVKEPTYKSDAIGKPPTVIFPGNSSHWSAPHYFTVKGTPTRWIDSKISVLDSSIEGASGVVSLRMYEDGELVRNEYTSVIYDSSLTVLYPEELVPMVPAVLTPGKQTQLVQDISHKSCQITTTTVSSSDSISTPAGNFDNCVHMNYAYNYLYDTTTQDSIVPNPREGVWYVEKMDTYYKENVGIVKLTVDQSIMTRDAMIVYDKNLGSSNQVVKAKVAYDGHNEYSGVLARVDTESQTGIAAYFYNDGELWLTKFEKKPGENEFNFEKLSSYHLPFRSGEYDLRLEITNDSNIKVIVGGKEYIDYAITPDDNIPNGRYAGMRIKSSISQNQIFVDDFEAANNDGNANLFVTDDFQQDRLAEYIVLQGDLSLNSGELIGNKWLKSQTNNAQLTAYNVRGYGMVPLEYHNRWTYKWDVFRGIEDKPNKDVEETFFIIEDDGCR